MSGKKLHVMMVNYWDFKLTSPASQGNANAHVKGGRRDLTYFYQASDAISNGCKQNITFKYSVPCPLDKTIL